MNLYDTHCAKLTQPPPRVYANPLIHKAIIMPDGKHADAQTGAQKNIRVLVADDHQVVLLGISKALETQPDIDVLAAAQTVSELMEALQQSEYDILVSDYSFGGRDQPDGLPMIKRIRLRYPDMKIILLTSHDDMMLVDHVVRLGVTGFLSKRSGDFTELPKIVRDVMQGQRYIDPQTSQAMVEYFLSISSNASGEATIARLSLREMDVVRLFAGGMTLTEIAQMTTRSLKTISTQKQSAMKKLGAKNDVELVAAFKLLRQEDSND
ncbi:response regulator transcription factor [Herbaspirillum sp. RTI4]|uniref:response regulator transcription factor n=1 Tax=Herbaspirillum sp. RTI4 TaxID=3048640 RepID=UPI002AB46B26|nr:response regulator transcription factor [Herbaspirillum sp. RTI4]MDY7577984.1 response regulator transcription factor [Herbaspirillum sp. RTI4]MEA9982086.1 response regulator transcription factor [Herbaspirillum sp. RTI4]